MENALLLERTKTIEDFTRFNLADRLITGTASRMNPIMETILSEGGEDFHQYVSWLGLSREPELMVLSSMHHYYYDHNDLKGIKALVNLKKLNQIRHLESFMYTLYRILNTKSYFVGCFKNNNQNCSGIVCDKSGKFINSLRNMLDSRTDRYMTKKNVMRMLEDHGFKVLDMTEIKGTVYFWAQNGGRSGE